MVTKIMAELVHLGLVTSNHKDEYYVDSHKGKSPHIELVRHVDEAEH
jgi:hypothetical protein